MDIPKICYFGGEPLGVPILEILASAEILPTHIVCNPDRPQGRKLLLTPPAVKVWAEKHSIPVFQPESLKDTSVFETLCTFECDLFIVVAYGKIIPENILNIPKYKTLNVHPSLLPKFRGPSPIRSAILEDMNPTGVSVMILTPGMDEGPILAQEEVLIPSKNWPLRGNELDALLAEKGGELLVRTLAPYIKGKITPQDQDHTQATYTKKITKDMGLINLDDDPTHNFLKIRAFDGWPGTYFFHEKNGVQARIKIVDATIENNKLKITRIIPEGKTETSYKNFISS